MKLSFHINYRTVWGESLYIVGDDKKLGAGDESKAVKMALEGTENWALSLEVADNTADFGYHYLVKHDNGYVKHEWGKGHKFCNPTGAARCDIYDSWSAQPSDKPYYSSAFTDCICNRGNRKKAIKPAKGKLTIRIAAPMVKGDQVLAISGDTATLGKWDVTKAVEMSDAEFPVWAINIDAATVNPSTEFKFFIKDNATGNVVAWEGRDNRTIGVTTPANDSTVIAGLRFVNPLAPWRGAGVAIPVFSIRSNDDFGVGDFYDLKLMVDWAVKTGQKFIQILPINDTTMTHTWTDSYPYNANSTFALHPMYLRLSELGRLKDSKRQRHFDDLAKELNSLKEIDYERVNQGKIEFFKEIFAQEGAKVLASADFKAFLKNNSHWLTPYAAFCSLRDKFGTPDFSKWENFATYDKAKVDQYVKENIDEINYVYYLQYNLDRQMRHVRDYAHANGIAIKGDIPIGISRTSADAWTDTRLFNMDCQAGAPPDDFSVLGQNWGFPTYNWEEMSKDGFAWWKARFRKMSEYFDAYRIDHVLGFFRIWQIPMNAVHGLLGIFNPAMPYSPDELRNNYDFWIDVDKQTTPYIMDWFMEDYFGPFTSEARTNFMHAIGDGRYTLNDNVKTQRQVVEYFAKLADNEMNNRLRDGLLGLIDNVLFIEDPYEKGKYHPRISAQFTHIYRSLNDYERWCFDRLYNDFYYHRHNDFWYGKAMWKLPPLIEETDMLVCAEDLGMIPACVPAVMNEMQIIALEIQRMPKDPKCRFGNTWHYPYYSVCTTSTHDMSGIRAWWEEDRAATQAFYNEAMHRGGEAPYFAEPWICDQIVSDHLKSPAMLCILPLQDWLSTDGDLRRKDPKEEQINVPANSRHYWRYRMHITVEDLNKQDAFNAHISEMISESGR
jgi:4-alpha-glucanotransferase